MDLLLKNKVVLVTGGASGMGAAIARALSQEEAIPVIVDRDAEAGHKVENELEGCGKQCLLIPTELASPDHCAAAVELTVKHFGRLEALVNHARATHRIGLEHGTPEAYAGSLQENLLYYYNMAHYALPQLKLARGGIVNISSKTALTAQGGTSGGATSKGAILALTREWAVELLPYNIRVNAIVSVEVMTPLDQPWRRSFPSPHEELPAIVSEIPSGKRMATPEDIAAMVVFLLSARAGHITGQQFFVDGGYVHLDGALT